MPNTRNPRSGSLQFWPRKRSKRKSARIRTFADSKDPKITGFAGYKIGMGHVQAIETNKYSHKKGQEITVPVTLVECPPLKLAMVRLYKKNRTSILLKKEIVISTDKILAKRFTLPKKITFDPEKVKEGIDEVRVIAYTIPSKTTIGKKAPDLFEVNVGGSTVDEKLNFVKENMDKEITFSSVFAEGDLFDAKVITKGKGFQGPVKRFGIHIRESKSEKSIRNPGSLGPWKGQGGIMWRVPHAGKMGYHQRTEYNKQVLKIVEDLKEINYESGVHKYGLPKNPVILVKGSLGGSKKRLVVMQEAIRSTKKPDVPTIEEIIVR
jgi:large subunit ribosomal protein L3